MHISFGHKYIYDFNLIRYLAKCVGYREIEKLKDNFEVPDEEIKANIKNKSKFWDLETETFVFKK